MNDVIYNRLSNRLSTKKQHHGVADTYLFHSTEGLGMLYRYRDEGKTNRIEFYSTDLTLPCKNYPVEHSELRAVNDLIWSIKFESGLLGLSDTVIESMVNDTYLKQGSHLSEGCRDKAPVFARALCQKFASQIVGNKFDAAVNHLKGDSGWEITESNKVRTDRLVKFTNDKWELEIIKNDREYCSSLTFRATDLKTNEVIDRTFSIHHNYTYCENESDAVAVNFDYTETSKDEELPLSESFSRSMGINYIIKVRDDKPIEKFLDLLK